MFWLDKPPRQYFYFEDQNNQNARTLEIIQHHVGLETPHSLPDLPARQPVSSVCRPLQHLPERTPLASCDESLYYELSGSPYTQRPSRCPGSNPQQSAASPIPTPNPLRPRAERRRSSPQRLSGPHVPLRHVLARQRAASRTVPNPAYRFGSHDGTFHSSPAARLLSLGNG